MPAIGCNGFNASVALPRTASPPMMIHSSAFKRPIIRTNLLVVTGRDRFEVGVSHLKLASRWGVNPKQTMKQGNIGRVQDIRTTGEAKWSRNGKDTR